MVISIKELQNYCTELLGEVIRLCELNHVPYFMFYGSLLGTIRHGGSIPWDSDVDIAVPEYAMGDFRRAMEQLDEKYWFDFRSDSAYPRCFGRVGMKGFDTYFLHVDVYRLIGYSDHRWLNRILSGFGHLLIRMRLVKTVDPSVYSPKKRRTVHLLQALLKPIPIGWIISLFDRICSRYPYETASFVGTQDGERWIIPKRCVEQYLYKNYENLSVRIPVGYDEALRRWYGDYMTPPDEAYISRAMRMRYPIKMLSHADDGPHAG